MTQSALAATMVLTLTEYIKTAQGKALIAEERLFAYENYLWQGFRGACVRVLDHQPRQAELERALDMDGCLQRIVTRRKAERSASFSRSQRETALKQAAQSKVETDLLQSAKLRKELGLEGASVTDLLAGGEPEAQAAEDATPDESQRFRVPDGVHPHTTTVPQIEEERMDDRVNTKLDAVLAGLTTVSENIGLLVRTIAAAPALGGTSEPEPEPGPGPEEVPAGTVGVFKCTLCNRTPPADHKNPAGWLRGHGMRMHKQRLA